MGKGPATGRLQIVFPIKDKRIAGMSPSDDSKQRPIQGKVIPYLGSPMRDLIIGGMVGWRC